MIRRQRPSRIGLVLGGGAARGWAHIGAIRALHDAGIKPDVICGTSIGALVGAIYANGDLDWLEEWVMTLTWRTVVRLLDVRISGGILGGRKVIRIFEDRLAAREIKDLRLPYAAVATELETGREVWLQDGGVADAVRASIAIPGLLTPVRRDGVWLVDGGLCNPVPVSLARAMRSDFVIAVDLNNDILNGRDFGRSVLPLPLPEVNESPAGAIRWWLPPGLDRGRNPASASAAASARMPPMLSSIAQSIDIMQVRITRSRLAGEPAEILVQPRLGGVGIFEFHRAGPAIAEGRAAVERVVPTIRAHLGLE